MNVLEDYNETLKSIQGEQEKLDFIMKACQFLQRHEEDSSGAHRRDIFLEYLKEIRPHDNDKLRAVAGESFSPSDGKYVDNCRSCDGRMVLDEARSTVSCVDCGVCEFAYFPALSFRDEQDLRKPNSYSYKRVNHYNEYLASFQGKENVKLPHDALDSVRREIKKQRLEAATLTAQKIREVLKKLRLNSLYEHAPYILSQVTGMRPPKLSPELENKFRAMFVAIQEPFDKHAPKERSNFLSYGYTIYKFAELCEEDWLLPHITLLKSDDKLRKQDAIWRSICKELRWQFIPTVRR